MNSAEDRNRASVLTKLLRAELRDARFSVTHLARTNTEFVPNEFGGGTSSDIEETFEEELDARGLEALHREGVWKRESFQSDIQVKALSRSSKALTASTNSSACSMTSASCPKDASHTPLVRSFPTTTSRPKSRPMPRRSPSASPPQRVYGAIFSSTPASPRPDAPRTRCSAGSGAPHSTLKRASSSAG